MRLIKGIVLAILIFIFLVVVNYLHVAANSNLFTEEMSVGNKFLQSFSSFTLATYLPSIVFLVVWLVYLKNQHIRSLFLEFLFPLAIAVYTVVTGTIGFSHLGMESGNAIFSAANLLTLNSSVFEGENGQFQNINLWLINARIIGAFFLMYAFFLALSLATGKENVSRLAFWIYRNIRRKAYHVIIGDSVDALFLAMDHETQGIKSVLLYNGDDSRLANITDKKAIYFMKGSGLSMDDLAKTYYEKADKVFVVNESEDDNFRVCQNMIKSKSLSKLKEKEHHWFVQIKDPRKRTLLSELSSSKNKINLRLFDTEQNIARKIVFTGETKAIRDDAIDVYENIVFGFNKLSEAIIIQLLSIGHFSKRKHLHIKVFYESKDQDAVSMFQSRHPELFLDEEDGKQWASLKHYSLLSHGPILEFSLLPQSESKLLHPSFEMYELIKPKSAVNIFVCLSSGLESASILTSILPRLKNTPHKYLQTFFSYDSIEENERQLLEEKLRNITRDEIPVSCFGSNSTNFTINSIEKKERDLLAMYIGFLYVKIYSQKQPKLEDVNLHPSKDKNLLIFDAIKEGIENWAIADIESNWANTSEIDKDSNRRAADQAMVKFALLGVDMNDKKELEGFDFGDKLDVLAEVEHRRWNVEKLLLGWLPTEERLSHDEWLQNKHVLRQQKFHYHLTDYESLPLDEKSKDYTQIMGLPYFMKSILSKVNK